MTSNRSLTGDLPESSRWIADVAVMEAFESRVLDLPDFHFTGDDYRHRFEPEAKHRFLDLLRERFNSPVKYKGRSLKWDTVVGQKTMELGRYLAGRTGGLAFSEPSPELTRTDSVELRRRILSLSQSDARKPRIAKSTFHHLRKNAQNDHNFEVYRTNREKLLQCQPIPRGASKR